MRVDQWLWFSRFFKTRALATAAVKGGHVRVNGERGKPGGRIKVGDRLAVVRNQLTFEITVTSLLQRRVSAREAAQAYTESEASIRARQAALDALRSDRLQMATTRGRPDKRTRRALRDRNRDRK